jgi:hypothetical protein
MGLAAEKAGENLGFSCRRFHAKHVAESRHDNTYMQQNNKRFFMAAVDRGRMQ